jgi:hypothetical protein
VSTLLNELYSARPLSLWLTRGRRLGPILTLLVSAAGLLACQPGFDPQSKVTKQRVLGVVASPPEVGFGGVASLRAVLSFPERVTDLTWTACPLSLGGLGGYACATDEIPLATDGPVDDEVILDGAPLLGFAASLGAFFPMYVEASKATLEQDDDCLRAVISEWESCVAAAGADVETGTPTCNDLGGAAAALCLRADGVEVYVRLQLDSEPDEAGGPPISVQSMKRVLFRDPPEGVDANTNPVLDGLMLGERTILDGETVAFTPGEKLEFTPIFDPEVVETYYENEPGEGEPEEETVYFSWFATAGSFSYTRTVVALPENTLKTPSASSDEATDEIKVWVFIRDDRFGAGLVSFTLQADGGAP